MNMHNTDSLTFMAVAGGAKYEQPPPLPMPRFVAAACGGWLLLGLWVSRIDLTAHEVAA